MTHKVISLLLLLLLLLGWSMTSMANDSGEARIYAAFDLLETMGLARQLDETIDRMVSLEVENNPGLMPYRHVLVEFYRRHIGYEGTKHETAELYAEAFTLEELGQLSAFYKTALGQKLVQKTPELVERSAQMGMQAVQQNLFELQEMIKDESLKIQHLQQTAGN